MTYGWARRPTEVIAYHIAHDEVHDQNAMKEAVYLFDLSANNEHIVEDIKSRIKSLEDQFDKIDDKWNEDTIDGLNPESRRLFSRMQKAKHILHDIVEAADRAWIEQDQY